MSTGIDIEIDKLTNSIENRITGDSYNTEVIKIVPSQSRILKKKDWVFDWKNELSQEQKEVYKLVTFKEPSIIQGLINIEDKMDSVFMHLIESASFNKGGNKIYAGVAGNLVAFACRYSFVKGYQGYVSFVAKSVLKSHYEKTLNAKVLYSNYMYLDTEAASYLIMKYFKNQ